jgi:hypothetical protein
MISTRILLALAILGGALFQSAPAAADAAVAQRLTALVHDHVKRQDVPPMVPGATYMIFIGEQRLKMDANELRQMVAMQRSMITSYRIEDFRVHAADCGPDLCWIRYSYRYWAQASAQTMAGEVNNQDLWVRNGDGFLLGSGISRQ